MTAGICCCRVRNPSCRLRRLRRQPGSTVRLAGLGHGPMAERRTVRPSRPVQASALAGRPTWDWSSTHSSLRPSRCLQHWVGAPKAPRQGHTEEQHESLGWHAAAEAELVARGRRATSSRATCSRHMRGASYRRASHRLFPPLRGCAAHTSLQEGNQHQSGTLGGTLDWSGQGRATQAKAEQHRPRQSNTGQGRATQAKAEQQKPRQSNTGQGRAPQAKAEQHRRAADN